MCKKWLRKNASFVVAVLLLGVLVGSVTGCVAESHEPYTQNYSALTTATDFSLGGEDRYFDKLHKAWCDSHGYKNNRPVPKAVPLNAKERECYWGLMRSGSKAALCAMVGNVGGVLTAAPGAAFTLYKCFK